MEERNYLRIVDVGALGGLTPSFDQYKDEIWPVMFEPNRNATKGIENSLRGYPRSTIVNSGLAHVDGMVDFTITRNVTCCSVLQPNQNFLRSYGISYHFETQGKDKIKCCRYDTLYNEGKVPLPDVIKIDVQGFEYQVLVGFGQTILDALAIRVESHFYPLYLDQRLFSDIVEYLGDFGFVLRKIECDKLDNFSGDLVEIDAIFTKSRRTIRLLDERQMSKFRIVTSCWNLPTYDLSIP